MATIPGLAHGPESPGLTLGGSGSAGATNSASSASSSGAHSTNAVNVKKVAPASGFKNSPFPGVDAFITDLAGVHSVAARIRKWVHFESTQVVTYEISGSRYCYNIGRPHRSNGVMYVANMLAGVCYQKCYDPDCAGFQSSEFRIPPDLIRGGRGAGGDDSDGGFVVDDEALAAIAELESRHADSYTEPHDAGAGAGAGAGASAGTNTHAGVGGAGVWGDEATLAAVAELEAQHATTLAEGTRSSVHSDTATSRDDDFFLVNDLAWAAITKIEQNYLSGQRAAEPRNGSSAEDVATQETVRTLKASCDSTAGHGAEGLPDSVLSDLLDSNPHLLDAT